MKIIFLIIFYLGINIIPCGYSHETGEYENVSRMMQISIDKLSPENIIKKSTNNTEYLEVKFDNRSIYLNRSIMLHALSDIYDELGKELGVEDKETLEKTKRTIFQYLSQKTIDFARIPYQFFKDTLTNLPETSRHLSLELPKLIHSRGLGSFVVIATTQIAWEAIETAISWSIGAGGAHAYCVIFNMALLRTVDNFRHLGQYLFTRGLEVSFKIKMKAFLLSVKRDWSSGRKSISSLPRRQKISEKFIHDFLTNNKIDIEIFKNANRNRNALLTEDFKLLGNQGIHSNERIWAGYQINLGVDYIDYVLNELINSFMEEHYTGSNRELAQKKNIYDLIWKFRKFQGFIHQQKENLKMAVTIESVSESLKTKYESINRLYTTYFESIVSLNDIVTRAHEILELNHSMTAREVTELTERLESTLKEIKSLQKSNVYLPNTSRCIRSIVEL